MQKGAYRIPAIIHQKSSLGGIMELQFEKPRAEDSEKIAPYFSMRPNKTCDSGMLDTYLWADYYKTRICIVEGEALLTVMQNDTEYFAALPYCKEEDLSKYFRILEEYFNKVLKKPLKIYLADQEGVEYLKLREDPCYIVREEEDFRDYLYSGEELRNLPGKRFHKKKNLTNKFKREYEGRWQYRSIDCQGKTLIWDFLDRWYEKRKDEESEGEESLMYEIRGIHEVLNHCSSIAFKAGGIFIDGQLEAFSMGAYNPKEKMACIDIEKGNPEIPGIYQMINQEFLLHEFPEAELVNREDDVGIPGLRRAKESYNPVAYERKFMLLQKDFVGYEKELADHYEVEIEHYEENASNPQGT